ncbi:type IV pilus twitching motility protein PilT [Agathobaculum sp.]|uniref:type IV pilus twitching motility protein PilT n=1 Tax=Agathobaculum sp. TaxID=2048138 RepID=UPI002A7F9C65|nr:PilT/PilU family type 4a pilus ATPase [Agathobaculum sp.]MDY3617759.1 PilT/PilU family type 4a pilus ATPase [Agathobaculum sp.]
MQNIASIVSAAAEAGASDIHIVCGLPVRLRVDGKLRDLDAYRLTHEDCEALARELSAVPLGAVGEIDAAQSFPDGTRVRINLFRQQGHASAAIRILSDRIPLLSSLGLPEAVQGFPRLQRGIVLVTGETGSGKSTTLAAILDEINHTRDDHIITLEDPIEYLYTPDRCVINQREIGRDTASYSDGLRAILREDPDVILIGEMRDLDTIETALTAAETGHLVFATLHTGSAADAVDRIVEVFPAGRQKQVRMQLSMTLQAVLSQQLLPRRGGAGRVAACELMMVTPAIRNLIREGKTPQIANALATSAEEGSITMDNRLIRMFKDKLISGDTARDNAHDPEYVRKHTLF